jgi:hypothetical protein
MQEEPESICPYCGERWQIVRPGKEQPNCDCQESKYKTLIVFLRHSSLYYFVVDLTFGEMYDMQLDPERYLYEDGVLKYPDIAPGGFRPILNIEELGIQKIVEVEIIDDDN